MNTNETPIELDRPEQIPDSVDVIGVSFRDSGKIYYFSAGGVSAKLGVGAVVETARGIEYGRVTMANRMIPKSELVLPLKKVLRLADEADQAHLEENRRKEDEAFRICQQKIREHGLDMKLIEAEYTFDNAKLLFYFTSEGRVDFRELVKDLASVFHTRIELRQIGIRDETKLMGGLGVCYREYCCHSFLGDFAQVSIKMAKEQGLSLNSAKISGACGRLMCCLRYEHETYQEEISRTPKVGAQLVTPDGTGVVVEAKPLMALVKVRLDADPDGAPRIYDRDLVRPKTDQDETTKRGEKTERPARPAFVPFTPLSQTPEPSDGENQPGDPSGEGRKQRHGKDRNRRKGERKPQGASAENPKGEKSEKADNSERTERTHGEGGERPHGAADRTRSGSPRNRPPQKGKPGQPKGGAERRSEGSERTERTERPARPEGKSRYIQPPENRTEPTLRADLTAPAEGNAPKSRPRRPAPPRKTENPTKKSENPEKND